MTRSGFRAWITIALVTAATGLGVSARADQLAPPWPVCLDGAGSRYRASVENRIDYAVVALTGADERRRTSLYIGYYPPISERLRREILANRHEVADRGWFALDGDSPTQYLRVSADRHGPLLLLVFADISAEERRSLLSGIGFCEQRARE